MESKSGPESATLAPPVSGSARNALWPIILITALFFFWGIANNLNAILIPQFRKAFILDDFQAGLVESAFYLGYFFFAIPAVLVMRWLGYKSAVVLGLLLYAAGAFLFWPAAEAHQYAAFLGALFIIASGLAFLETSANPLITVLGTPEKAAFRLNLAQAFNPLGSITGIFIGQHFILSGIHHDEAALEAMSEAARQAFYVTEVKAVQGPYLLIGVIVLIWAALVLFSKFPAAATRNAEEDSAEPVSFLKSLSDLFSRPRFLFGVVAQFFYVGAQAGIWSYMIRYGQQEMGLTEKGAANFLYYALIAFAIGRFFGTALMSRLPPMLILGTFALVNIGLTISAVTMGGENGMWTLVASSFFMSVMFPTIFATALEGLGNLTKTGASLLVMSIIGGAVLTPLMGYISVTSHEIRLAFLVSTLCFAVIATYAFTGPKTAKTDVAPAGH